MSLSASRPLPIRSSTTTPSVSGASRRRLSDGQALGGTPESARTFDEDDQVCIEPPEGSPEDGVEPDILFLKVPEGK